MQERNPRRFFIVGPTAGGKSRLAIEVALLAGGEVLSVDSMKVYRGMDVGTAKPSAKARRGIPFHLIDIRDPAESMSVAEFVREARRVEREVIERGSLPIFSGGTALYVRGLTEGVFEGPSADWAFRRALFAEAAEKGNEALHARLAAVDPVTASRVHPNDVRRVVRAIEVFEKTGQPISALQREWWDAPAARSAGSRGARGAGPAREGRLLLGLLWSRDALCRRIDERVERMFENGLVEEARLLLASPKGVGREAAQALGYNETFRWLREGERRPLEQVRAEVKRNTRRFARRQMTFFRSFPDVEWIPVDETSDPRALAREIVQRYLGPRRA